jgi:hypothetical protein
VAVFANKKQGGAQAIEDNTIAVFPQMPEAKETEHGSRVRGADAGSGQRRALATAQHLEHAKTCGRTGIRKRCAPEFQN